MDFGRADERMYPVLSEEDLVEITQARLREYRDAEPFPHLVIDDFLPKDLAEAAAAVFPGPEAGSWLAAGARSKVRAHKHTSRSDSVFSPPLHHVLTQLNAHPVLKLLERLTGIGALIADPEIGQCLRHFTPGGFLEIHADYSWLERLKLNRRVNLILYLSPDWQADWGSDLELWAPDMSRRVRRIAPLFNRAVIFATGPDTPHGFLDPVSCPSSRTRQSLNLYYYTVEKPAGWKASAKTDFKRGRLARRRSRLLRAVRRLFRYPRGIGGYEGGA